MQKQFKILLLEDSSFDAELIQRELKKGGINFTSKVVETKDSFKSAIADFAPDIILADHSLPQFNSREAILVCKEMNYKNPFILVTGSVSEEFAVASIQNGADDYILKNNLTRLISSINNSLDRKNSEKEKERIRQQLVKAESQVRSFATHINNVLEEERAHIAREIHDELGQQLAGIKMDLSFLKKEKDTTDHSKQRIDSLLKVIDESIQSMRKIATKLRPGILDTLGLGASLEWLGKEFEKRTQVKCALNIAPEQNKIDKRIATCFFRICQETLTNISKHAKASEVSISLKEEDGEMTLNISDNGIGILKEKLDNPFSMGLIGMKERAKIIGAELSIMSQKGEGTAIQLRANLQPETVQLNSYSI